MIRCIVSVCLTLYIGNALFAQDAKLTPKSITTNSNSHGFYEYLPQGYSTSAPPYALLIFLQGLGERGNGSTDLDKLLANGPLYYIKNDNSFPKSFTVGGKTFKFVIISPQFIIDTVTHGQIDSLITYSLQHYNVDINRVYLTGLSWGGGLSFEYAGDSSIYAKRLAALIPFASATPPGWDTVKPRAKVIANSGLHVWAFHNQYDDVSDTITTNYVKFINQYSAIPNLARQTIFNTTGHDSWSPAYYGSYQENGLNMYQWMLQFQGTNIVTPLPVKFSYINAGCSDNKVVLRWKTAQENGSRNFIIERSADGVKWNSIATVAAAGNSALEKSYEFDDLTNAAAGNLYRIAENDLDGKTSYSSSVKAECDLKEYFGFFPNPANNKVIFRINTSQQQKLQLRIYDSRGVLMKVYEATLHAGNAEQSIDINQLSKGVYTVKAIWGVQSKTVKLVKS